VLAWSGVVAGLQSGRGRGAPLAPDVLAAVNAAFGSPGGLRDAIDAKSLTLGAARRAFIDAFVATAVSP
jgi:hypothetical protein